MTDQLAETSRVNVRITVKARNLYLSKFIERHGSLARAAAVLGINVATLSGWLNFRCNPLIGRHGKAKAGKQAERMSRIVLIICEELQCSPRDVFPALATEHLKLLCKAREYDTVIKTESLERCRLTYDGTASDFAENKGAAEVIEKQLKTLSYREREIIRLRYGLDGNGAMSLGEVGKVFKVGKERIRQIESKALRLLQMPARSDELVGLLPQESSPTYRAHRLPGGPCRYCREYFLSEKTLADHQAACASRPR